MKNATRHFKMPYIFREVSGWFQALSPGVQVSSAYNIRSFELTLTSEENL